jgi:hypothetical protein
MKVEIVKTELFNKENSKNAFPSLRCALEWAKKNNISELKLTKIIIK